MEVNTDSAPVPLARSVSLRLHSLCLLPLSASRLNVLIFHLGLQWSSFVLLIIFKGKKKGSVNPRKSIDTCSLFAASCYSQSFFFLIQSLFKGVKRTVFQERPGKRTTGGNNTATQL